MNIPIDQLFCGDAVELSREKLSDCSIHAIVTDPPYGLEFMGEEWDKFKKTNKSKYFHKPDLETIKGFGAKDFGTPIKVLPRSPEGEALLTYQRWTTSWATEALRVLKPGAPMLVMGGTRTYHRMTCGVEDAGFVIKDTLCWAYNQGFPKSQDLGIMFDKRECGRQLERKLGRKPTKAEFKEAWKGFREVIGQSTNGAGNKQDYLPSDRTKTEAGVFGGDGKVYDVTIPATPLAREWDGWKVGGLKPAYEPILWAVKPPDGAYIDNVLRHGVGAINVDGCRIPYENENDQHIALIKNQGNALKNRDKLYGGYGDLDPNWQNDKGRYPANMIRTDRFHDGYDRFYFIPKASRAERDEGLDSFGEISHSVYDRCAKCGGLIINKGKRPSGCTCDVPQRVGNKVKNIHPTVKPVALMEHLIRLVTREGQVVLDPFVGSGTTCIAARKLLRHYIGFDNNSEYIGIAKHRLAAIPKSLEDYSERIEV